MQSSSTSFPFVTRHCSSFQDQAEQEELERIHREEEDRLYLKFASQREQEDQRLKEEFKVSLHILPTWMENHKERIVEGLFINMEVKKNLFCGL